MREKILAQLIAKFSGVSKRFLGLIADKLAKKVTDESGIEQAITDYDNAASITDLAADFQKEGDHRVTTAKQEWEKKKPKTDPDDDNDDVDPPKKPKKKDDDIPAWAKALTEEIQSLKKDKVQTSIQSQLATKLKDKDGKDKVPASFYKGRALPEKEEDLDAFVTQIETDWTEFKQEQVNAGLMSATPPAGGGGSASGGAATGKEEADIAAWAEKQTPKDTKK